MAKAKVLTKDEMKRVEKIIAADSNATRNMLAFKLSILGGMRVGEVAALTVGQVRGLDGKAVAVINLSKEQTKGHKARRVFLNDELQTAVTKFLVAQRNVADDVADDVSFISSATQGLVLSYSSIDINVSGS